MESQVIFKTSPIINKELPQFDIIIPYHGEYSKVYQLVMSIYNGLRSNSYRICLVDDNSPNIASLDVYKKAPRLVSLRNEEQLGFGASVNLGLQVTDRQFFIVMHSDCTYKQINCIHEMFTTYMRLQDQGVRLVSARSNNPGDHPNLKAERGEKGVDTIMESFSPFYCALVNRESFVHLGGFKEYPYGYYEDEELFYRMKSKGFKQAVSALAWIEHEGGATFNSLFKIKGKELGEQINKNREQCILDIKKVKKR